MRCKNCREKFEPRYFNQKYCLQNTSCITAHVDYAKRQNQKSWRRRRKRIKEELKTIKDYHKDCQYWFNKVVRERDKNKDCISCGVSLKNRKFDAGHYYSQGGHSSLRYDFENVHGQCVPCNRELSGNLHKYRLGLIERVGEEVLDELEFKAHIQVRYTIQELKDKIQEYKKYYREMTQDPD